MADPEARKKVVWEMDTMAMNDAAYLILLWPEFYHVRWNFGGVPITGDGIDRHKNA